MAKLKMKYGIDLGTTNSAICKMENGEPTIKKTDTLKDTNKNMEQRDSECLY